MNTVIHDIPKQKSISSDPRVWLPHIILEGYKCFPDTPQLTNSIRIPWIPVPWSKNY
jgi:hypothetical protein